MNAFIIRQKLIYALQNIGFHMHAKAEGSNAGFPHSVVHALVSSGQRGKIL